MIYRVPRTVYDAQFADAIERKKPVLSGKMFICPLLFPWLL
jgi:hypothetical protein